MTERERELISNRSPSHKEGTSMTERQTSLTPNLSPCSMATHRLCTERVPWHTILSGTYKPTTHHAAMCISVL